MCKEICLLTMPNKINCRLLGLRPEEELVLKILVIQRDICRESSKILKGRKKKLLSLQIRKRNIKRLTILMILLQMKSQLLIPTVYLSPMLRLKTVLNLKVIIMRRMIHLKFEKKKHLTNVRGTLKKTSSQGNMGRRKNHGYRNPCPFQVSPSNLKKKSITISFVNGLNLFFFKSL